MQLYIFNSLGQKITEVIIGELSHLTIDTSHLASGLYIIKTNNNAINPLKFIKN